MNLVFFLEEPSAREMLKGLLPRLLPEQADIRYIVFEGKQDLERNLTRRMRSWLVPDSVFVVLRDQDGADCPDVKRGLAEKCREAGGPCQDRVSRAGKLVLRRPRRGGKSLALAGLTRHGRKKKYRIPDRIHSPSRELVKITGNVYQKFSGSRSIGPCLSTDANRSHSFRVFVTGSGRSGMRQFMESVSLRREQCLDGCGVAVPGGVVQGGVA